MVEFNLTVNTNSLLKPANWTDTNQSLMSAGDIRHPWKSVYGFATSAARLAANQGLILHCREDEVFDLLTELNELLGQPEVLNRASTMLRELEVEKLQKLARLVNIQEQPVSASEATALVEQMEWFLVKSAEETVANRLAETISPHQPADEISGLRKMVSRLQTLMSGLEKVKDHGIHVVIQDRRRQPARPALEARRNEPIFSDTQPKALPAGFLLPTRHHATLWAYVVVRSDKGQSTIWN